MYVPTPETNELNTSIDRRGEDCDDDDDDKYETPLNKRIQKKTNNRRELFSPITDYTFHFHFETTRDPRRSWSDNYFQD